MHARTRVCVLLQLKKEFKNVAGEMYIPKLIAFLYISNEQSENESRKNNFIHLSAKRIKYIGTHLMKDVQGLYREDHKTLFQKLNKTQVKGKIYYVYTWKT